MASETEGADRVERHTSNAASLWLRSRCSILLFSSASSWAGFVALDSPAAGPAASLEEPETSEGAAAGLDAC